MAISDLVTNRILTRKVAGCARALGVVALLTACSQSDTHPSKGTSALDGGGGKGGSSGAPATGPTSSAVNDIPTGPPLPTPDGGVPAADGTTTLTLPTAPALPDKVKVVSNRSSVILHLPGVQGAKDYRVFAIEDGVKVSVDATKHEHVDGATITCAGLRQRNQCDQGEVLPIKYNNDLLDMGDCDGGNFGRHPNVPAELMQTVEVDGLKANTTLVVEAIDRQCPFPGLFGPEHKDINIVGTEMPGTTEDATINGKAYKLTRWPATFPVQTEAEIRAQYGSMILNGEGPNNPTLDPTSPNYPESPYIRIAQPAPANDPIVLGRSVISVSPTGDTSLPDGFTDADYFDDFDDSTDQPVLLRTTDYVQTLETVPLNVYTTKKWVLYDVLNQFSEFFVDRGQMNMVMGDPGQDAMSVQAMYPKRPVKLPDLSDTGKYLHVTYEVQRDETARRYENFTLCGADTVGDTYDGDTPKEAPLPRPGFMNDGTTARTSALGWNCLYLVPRGPGYGVIPGGDVAAGSHADTLLKITAIKTNPKAVDASDYDSVRITPYATAFGPTQDIPFPKEWARQVDDSKQISNVWLDDQLFVWQRTKFDVFVRRDRVVIYVNGQMRLCQDIGVPLTMAEGALGFWHILYHTSAEFTEIRDHGASSSPATGQHQILHNTPFADQRSWDNVGFRESVPLPSDFDEGRCYTGN